LKKTEQKNANASILLTVTKSYLNKDRCWYVNRFSSYIKLKRVLAWIKRFYMNTKSTIGTRRKGNLSFEELREADILLVKLIQAESFSDNEGRVRIEHLLPFQDENGLIRIKTKIIERDDTYNFRCLIVLPGDHQVIGLVINEKHRELNHAGVEILMSALREDYWILGGRKVIRSIIRKCVNCRRHDIKPLQSLPAPLPLNRVRDAAVFEIVGVDFTGPIFLKGGQKAWICLFTCAVFRAVHLELVTSLSTASFLMALRRHIARRGRPSVIYSDNGTNFVGMNNTFKHIDFKELATIVATKQMSGGLTLPLQLGGEVFGSALTGF
jgi:Integrase core domain.